MLRPLLKQWGTYQALNEFCTSLRAFWIERFKHSGVDMCPIVEPIDECAIPGNHGYALLHNLSFDTCDHGDTSKNATFLFECSSVSFEYIYIHL